MTIWRPDLAEPPGPVFRAIAAALARDIDAGLLKPGDRLPTHRDLADRLGLTVPTISKAYRLAHDWGLISGEVGRGTFVRRPHSEASRHTPPHNQTRDTIDLSSSEPVRLAGIEAREVADSLATLASRADLASIIRGPKLLAPSAAHDAVAAWLAEHLSRVKPDTVMFAAGPQHALCVVFLAIASPGSTILTEPTTYPGMRLLAESLRLRLIPVPTDQFGIVPDALESACRKSRPVALYTVPTIHIVTTTTMSLRRREEIASIARKHNVYIVEDDEYTVALPRPPKPLSSFAPEHSIYVIDTNKALAPGIRIAPIVFPPRLAEALVRATRATTWTIPPLMLEMTVEWITSGRARRLLHARAIEADKRRSIVLQHFKGRQVSCPKGAHHAWIALPRSRRYDEFAAKLYERGIIVGTPEECTVKPAAPPNGITIGFGGEPQRDLFEQAVSLVAAAVNERPARNS